METYQSLYESIEVFNSNNRLNEETEVQSILFSKDPKYEWTVSKAKQWLKSHGYKYGDVDDSDTKEYIHFRQVSPDSFDTFRFSKKGASPGQSGLADKGIKMDFGIDK